MFKPNKHTRTDALGARERTWLSYVATLDVKGVLQELNTCRTGLTEAEVEASREAYGDNRLVSAPKQPAIVRFVSTFADPFVLILIVLALVSLVTDVIMAQPAEADPATPGLIAAMALVSVALRFAQESKGTNAAQALADTIECTCCVERAGLGRQEIPLSEVVRGDIIHLAAGDIIPADIRLIATRDLFVGESQLTGESDAIEKTSEPTDGLVQPLEATNLCFLGTTVISGTGVGVACNVGASSMLGAISTRMSTTKKETAYDRGVREVSMILVRLMLIVAPLVFLISALTKGQWLDALLFALSVAVGLTPEMLPMIVTTCLAKGAVVLSKKRVIVKRLDAVQNLGAIDLLCCDKTGTLTEDRVVLVRHLDASGKESDEVLKAAFLNSHFETGMLNLIDTAIIERAHAALGVEDEVLVADNYLVDELPFDYERRRVSVVVGDANGVTQMISKGAIEEVIDCCTMVKLADMDVPLTPMLKADILERAHSLSDSGMRVLGVATKKEPEGAHELDNDDERDMTLIGYLAFLDPPKTDAADAVKALADHGVAVKVLTGDSARVAACVCSQIGIDTSQVLTGADIEGTNDEELQELAERATIFAKLSPDQKARIVASLKATGHTVGFMGDGVNDSAAMEAADCGISVDTAADVAKEAADIILLEKDLGVLEEGVRSGRATFANMNKYVKLTASSNFGNVFAVLAASAFLPFLPMKAAQLLFLNFVYDIGCTSIPTDNVDEEALAAPATWDSKSIVTFMRWMGPVSSVFDILTFLLLFFVVCPACAGGAWSSLATDAARATFAATFQSGWLWESMCTQVLALHLLRTEKIPFLESRASLALCLLTLADVVVASIFCLTPVGATLDLAVLPLAALPQIFALIVGYGLTLMVLKRLYIKRYGKLL